MISELVLAAGDSSDKGMGAAAIIILIATAFLIFGSGGRHR